MFIVCPWRGGEDVQEISRLNLCLLILLCFFSVLHQSAIKSIIRAGPPVPVFIKVANAMDGWMDD